MIDVLQELYKSELRIINKSLNARRYIYIIKKAKYPVLFRYSRITIKRSKKTRKKKRLDIENITQNLQLIEKKRNFERITYP